MVGYWFDECIQKEFVFYWNCDYVIVMIEQQVDLIVEYYQFFKDYILMILLGIDEIRFIFVMFGWVVLVCEKYDFFEKDIYVVGWVVENKGYDLVIEVLLYFFKLQLEVWFVFVVGVNFDSDNDLLVDWKQIVFEFGVVDWISWCGYVVDDDLVDFYCVLGIFVLLLCYEFFGMMVVEVMVCGMLMVVIIYGGLFEQVEFGCYVLVVDFKWFVEFVVMLNMLMQYVWMWEMLFVEGVWFVWWVFGWIGIVCWILQVFE